MQGRCYSRWQLNGPSGGYLLAATRHIVSKWNVGNPTSINSMCGNPHSEPSYYRNKFHFLHCNCSKLYISCNYSHALVMLLKQWPGVMWLFFTFHNAQSQFACVVTAWTLVKLNCGYFEVNCGYFEAKSNLKSVPANIWQPHAQYWDWPFTFWNILIADSAQTGYCSTFPC